MYVAPEDKTAKPYNAVRGGPQETKQDAIAKIAMYNREHMVLIRPSDGGLILHTLYYPDELHKSKKSEAPKSPYSVKKLVPTCTSPRTNSGAGQGKCRTCAGSAKPDRR